MSKKNGGKKRKSPGTFDARLAAMLERIDAWKAKHGPKRYPNRTAKIRAIRRRNGEII